MEILFCGGSRNLQICKKKFIFTNDEGKLSAEECIFSEEKWKKLDTAHDPARGIEFIDLYKSDKNLKILPIVYQFIQRKSRDTKRVLGK